MVKGKRQGDNEWYLKQTKQEQGNFVSPIFYILKTSQDFIPNRKTTYSPMNKQDYLLVLILFNWS